MKKQITFEVSPQEERVLSHVMANLARLIREGKSYVWMEGREYMILQMDETLNTGGKKP